MGRGNQTDYEAFEASSAENRRLLRETRLVHDVTIALSESMRTQGISRSRLARKLKTTPAYVTQVLNGRNMTLRTLARFADALNTTVSMRLVSDDHELAVITGLVQERIEPRVWTTAADVWREIGVGVGDVTANYQEAMPA